MSDYHSVVSVFSIHTQHRSLVLKALYVSGAVPFKFVFFVHYPDMLLIFITKILVSYKNTDFCGQFRASLSPLLAVCAVCILLWSFA